MSAPDNRWRVGDLAVCIVGWATPPGIWQNTITGELCRGPVPGQILRVCRISGEVDFDDMQCVGLEFDAFPGDTYPSPHFRKIKPDAEPADDAALIALIRGQRVEVAA